MRLRLSSSVWVAALSACAFGQAGDSLTLQEALAMARANNGTVRSAFLNYEAARSSTRAAHASYLPSVTPSASYDTGFTNFQTGTPGRVDSVTSRSSISASWLLFDNGERDATFLRSKVNRGISELSTLQTLRTVLFNVHSRFFDALRAEELLKVQQSQMERTDAILKRTILQIELGASPQKDRLQAEADSLNARVAELRSLNQVATAQANLKAIIGLPEQQGLPALTQPEPTPLPALTMTLEEAIAEGMRNRPDLEASRLRVQSQEYDLRLAQLNMGPSWSVQAQYTKAFSPDVSERQALVLAASWPLYDGNRSRENTRAAALGVQAQVATMGQAERDARAEIESAYKEYAQNSQRLAAASAALAAAKKNYEAASGAADEGASDLIEVLTAQVSLATAESNYVEAYYDALISEVRLGLALGREVPGEK